MGRLHSHTPSNHCHDHQSYFPPVTAWKQGLTIPESGEPIFRSYAPEVAQTQQVGQAFHSVGFEAECNIINCHWATKRGLHHRPLSNFTDELQVLKGNISCRTILTKTVIQIINNTKQDKARVGRLEPPYMLPSADLKGYSKVCISNPLPMMWLMVQSGAPFATTLGVSWYSALGAGWQSA